MILPPKNAIFHLSESENLVNFVKFYFFHHDRASFCHFVSFSAKTRSFGAYAFSMILHIFNQHLPISA